MNQFWICSSPEAMCQFQPNLAQSSLGWRGFKFVQKRAKLFSKGRYLQNSENTLMKFKNLLRNQSNLAQCILWWWDSRSYMYNETPFSYHKKMIVFQRYNIIIHLSKCVYWFKLVFQVSDVLHGPLVRQIRSIQFSKRRELYFTLLIDVMI